ncbi:MAG TPA: lipocalin-like domain-containing protein [Vicinamibacterales bacterium]|nr:lipocalin-like domain-containing protein [Vicinamibacterales bacterium]
MQRLIGNWTLLSYVTENPDGSQGKPYGDAVGRLSYDGHGNMAGQVMRPGRLQVAPGQWGALEVRSAYAGYIAYFGTYEVNASEDTVIHHVHGALNPNWVGGHQVRRMRFDGELLVLSTDVPKAGAMVRHTLTWKKLA